MDDTRDMCNIYGQDRYNINVTKCTEKMSRDARTEFSETSKRYESSH